jgi:hypothetical protein
VWSTKVLYIGGNYKAGDAPRPDDVKALNAMFEDVKAFLAGSETYKGLRIDLSSIFPKIQFSVNTSSTALTKLPGIITIGVGTGRSRMEYYSYIIHELRHAVKMWNVSYPADAARVRTDEGANVEGCGVAVESQLIGPLMQNVLGADDVAYTLYSLDYGIRDARFVGTTDATLEKYFRPSCDDPKEPNTIDFTKAIAERYGLTGPKADTVALRAHIGSQYFYYISGGLAVLDEIKAVQALMPAGTRAIDPYVLFACEANNPSTDPAYIEDLKACLK